MLSGYASLGAYNPTTGCKEFVMISTYDELALGQGGYQKLEAQHTISQDPRFTERLRRIGQGITQISDRQDCEYKFFVVEDNQRNAFTTPGGNVYVFSGLMSRMNDEQLASMISHEVGHGAAKHIAKKYQAALGYDLITGLAVSLFSDESSQQLAGISTAAVLSLVSSKYNRLDEYEADLLAVKYMQRAGYDPQAIISAFEILQANSGGPQTPLILRSHPYLDDRIKAVRKEIDLSKVRS